jgi:hypothetical protein
MPPVVYQQQRRRGGGVEPITREAAIAAEEALRAEGYARKDAQLLRLSASDVAAIVGLKRGFNGKDLVSVGDLFTKYGLNSAVWLNSAVCCLLSIV